ncbi:MAG: branched-chain amino acid ABC transporter permease [Deltaproteobacteria bacterium]|nr:branched-chain amino acid ABC transporter permease [Deltaproteobacteria bacterium]
MTFLDQVLQYLFTGLTTGSIYALIAIGFCLIHNSTGAVNFTQVDFVTLGGMMMYTFLQQTGLPMSVSFFLAIATVTLVGVAFQWLAIRPARSREVIIIIFITIGASHVIRGLIKIIWGKNSMAVPPLTGDQPILLFNAAILPQTLWIVAITIATVILLQIFFYRTLTGKAMRAVAVNPRAAALAGIKVQRLVMLSFGLAGALGALAGILIVPIATLNYEIGVMLGLKGFAAAILGGYGHFFGAIIGGLILGVAEALGAGFISSTYKDVLAFVILLLVLFARPGGIVGFGQADRV